MEQYVKVYYKVRQVLVQSATGIIKCDNFITKCDRYYKVQRLLQSATIQGLTKNHEYCKFGSLRKDISKYR